jgi:hypothetical protein
MPAAIARGQAGFTAEESKLFLQEKTEETEIKIKISVLSVSSC